MEDPMKKTFTGWYGFAIIPDQETRVLATEIGQQHSDAFEYAVRDHEVQLPHISLYHAQLQHLPNADAEGITKELNSLLGLSLVFREQELFGGTFLFWNVLTVVPLQVAHKFALEECAPYYKQPREAFKPSSTSARKNLEQEMAHKHGFALSYVAQKPHITLAAGLKEEAPRLTPRDHIGKVERIVFARFQAPYGAIQEVIYER